MTNSILARAGLLLATLALAACGASGTDSSSSASASTNSSASLSAPSSVIALSSAIYTVPAASSTAVISVDRTGTGTGATTVGYTTADGSALAGDDYVPTAGSLTWADGDQTPKTISISISDSGNGKSFGVSLTSVSDNASFGSPTTAMVAIGGTDPSDSSSSSSSSSSGGSGATSSSGGSSSSGATVHPSANGTMIPSATRIVDSAGNSWSVSGGVIALNGSPQTITKQVVLLLYYNSTISQENSNCDWWSWKSGAWVAVAKPAASGIPGCSANVTDVGTGGGSSSGSGGSSGSGSSSSSSSSSSGGAGNSGAGNSGSVPPAATAVGYTTMTFGPGLTLGSNWFPWVFYGSGNQPAGYATQEASGTLLVSGNENNHYGASVTSVQKINGGNNWAGAAFGGGAYFEAVLSFTGQTDSSYPNGGPAFWLKDIEQFSQGPYPVNWPGGSAPAWNSGTSYSAGQQVSYSGQIWQSLGNGNVNHAPPNPGPGANAYWTGYNDFFEIDVMEYDSANSKYPYTYQVNLANWHGIPTTGSGPSELWTDAVPGSIGSILAPSGTDFSQPHKYGFLWVPATGSGQTTYTRGYAIAYFDDVQVTPTAYWNYHDPNDSAHYPAPGPVLGDTCLSEMDWRHLAPILGTDPNHPMTVYSVTVWQASADHNLSK